MVSNTMLLAMVFFLFLIFFNFFIDFFLKQN